MTRLDRTDYFMLLAHLVSLRSTCDRANVGAVLVKDQRVIATGYNGSPKGLPHCSEVGHLLLDGHCVRTVHAEQNTLIQAARYGTSTIGAILYTTHSPCLACARLLINAGVTAIVHRYSYDSPLTATFLRDAYVGLIAWTPSPDCLEALRTFSNLFPSSCETA